MDAIKSRVLDNRGVGHPEVYSPKNLINPNGLMDGHKAGMRIAAALIRRQRIALVADFDCDSATGAAVMKKGLSLISETLALAGRPKSTANPVSPNSVSDIQIVVPDRRAHGHGLTPSLATEVIHDIKANLIITLGTGSNEHAAAILIHQWQDAPDLIVLDHHAPAGTAPDTYALISPNRSDCQFESKAIHSTGLAFYMLILVRRCMVELIGGTPRGTAMADRIRAVPMNHLSDLVALGTIGDKAPLDANNRLLVKMGLERINKGHQMTAKASHDKGYLSYGLRALLEVAKATYPITTHDLDVHAAQRLNSVGRLALPAGLPDCGIECLLADNQNDATRLAKRCDDLNTQRKDSQAAVEAHAKTTLDSVIADLSRNNLTTHNPDHPPATALAMKDDTWHTGLVGLIASRLATHTGATVFCFAPETSAQPPDDAPHNTGTENAVIWQDAHLPETGNPASGDVNWLKGSGRSDSVHLRDALAFIRASNPDLLMQYSGHAGAASVTLYRPHLPRFRRLLTEAVDYLLATAPLQSLKMEALLDHGPLPATARTFPLAHWIEQQPRGNQFPEPQFTQSFRIVKAQTAMDVHQMLIAVDANANPADGQSGTAEPLQMLWCNSVGPDTLSP